MDWGDDHGDDDHVGDGADLGDDDHDGDDHEDILQERGEKMDRVPR